MQLSKLINVSGVPVINLVRELVDSDRIVGEPGQFIRQMAERLGVHEGAVRSAIAALFQKHSIKKIFIGTSMVGIELFNHKDNTPAKKDEWRELHAMGATWRRY